MNNINYLYRYKQQLENLRNDVQSVIRTLSSAIESFQNVPEKLEQNYTVDEVSYDRGSNKNYLQSLIKEKNELSSDIINSINKEIAFVQAKIDEMLIMND